MIRDLNEYEKLVISRVAERLPDGERMKLLEDAACACVEEESVDKSRIRFGLRGYTRPQYHGQRSLGIEGQLMDQDGASVSIDLYCDQNGRLLELELIRWGNGSLISPDWTSLQY